MELKKEFGALDDELLDSVSGGKRLPDDGIARPIIRGVADEVEQIVKPDEAMLRSVGAAVAGVEEALGVKDASVRSVDEVSRLERYRGR